MDAHLFRLLASDLERMLPGARLEKIQEPAKNHLNLLCYNDDRKFNLCFRFGRPDPFCFLSTVRPAAMREPSAQVMRLRKYFGGRRIRSVVFQVWERKLWLMASLSNGDAKDRIPWLCLDLGKGPSLHFLSMDALPVSSPISWPNANELEEAMTNWQNWPCMTPALRKALRQLDVKDAAALMADLEAGSGDVFLYMDEQDKVAKISAWPLVKAGAALREIVMEDHLGAFERAGHDLVLNTIAAAGLQQQEAENEKRLRKLNKTLAKLDEDEKRLLSMSRQSEKGEIIAANLWRLPKDAKLSLLEIPGLPEVNIIELDDRYTLAENMRRFFHTAKRGQRGLAMLEERRRALQAEESQVKNGRAWKPGKSKAVGNNGAGARSISKNRHVQSFVSSDGFTLLRGRDARGNQLVRRIASGHDLWTHVEEGPGAHVIIRRSHGAEDVPLATLMEAGALAANKSWLKDAGSASVMYAEVRHIKPNRAAGSAQVLIDKLWRVMTVPVRKELEDRLMEKEERLTQEED